ncbi:MAG: hypothetical protein NTW19_09630 [Planctomycetota bacterium]|nr:hypothetical protein [Planctomycetota bacterium]
MRRTLPVAVCLAFSLSPLVGCSDRQSAEQAKTHGQFVKALNGFQAAQDGFVPKGEDAPNGDGQPTVDLQAYRTKALLQAAKSLEATIGSASESDKLQARRLVADAYATAADQVARAAMSDWVDISRQSASLVNKTLLIDRDDARSKAFDIDDSPLVAKLKEQQQEAQTAIVGFEKEASGLVARGNELTKSIEKARAESDAAVGQISKLRSEAFVKDSKAQDALYGKASGLEGAAATTRAVAQKLTAELDVVQGELAVVKQQLELRKSNVTSLQDQIAGVEQRQKKNHDERDSAANQKEKAVSELKESLVKIAADYDKLVDAKLAQAGEYADKSIKALADGVSQARGADKKAYQLDLLSKHAVRASVYTQHLTAAAGYGKTLGMLAKELKRVMPSETSFSDAQQKAADSAGKLAISAREAVGQGSGLATELKTGGEDANVDAIFQSLQGYAHNVDEATGVATPTPADSNS